MPWAQPWSDAAFKSATAEDTFINYPKELQGLIWKHHLIKISHMAKQATDNISDCASAEATFIMCLSPMQTFAMQIFLFSTWKMDRSH